MNSMVYTIDEEYFKQYSGYYYLNLNSKELTHNLLALL